MSSKVLSISLAVLLLAGATAWADWNVGDGDKMHFPQLPDEEGWDVNATFPKVLADDWQCSQSGWVNDIHWWGSWKDLDGDQMGDVGTITSFHISIHSNIVDGGQGFSVPGPVIIEEEFTPQEPVHIDPPALEGWYDPNDGSFIANDHGDYWQYNLFIPDNWFWQDQGVIYWLDISANVVETDHFWGWKSSQDHFMDDAVMGHLPAGAPWTELFEPPNFTQSLDLAFVITPEPATLILLALGGAVLLRKRRA